MRVENSDIDILHKTDEKVFSFAGEEVLKMNIDNFRVRSPDRLFDVMVNKALEKQQHEFLRNVYLNLYPSAVKDFKNSKINNFFFAPYEAFLAYTVSMNQNCVLSFYYDDYTFTGGAHGTTTRKSQTYSYKTRRKLSLLDFFKSKAHARSVVINEMVRQARVNLQDNPGIYFDNYEMLIRKNFNPENFFLTPQGIVIYYNQYEIAPYSTGIVEFLIPYSMTDYPPVC